MPPGRNDYVIRYLPGFDDSDPAIEKKWANEDRSVRMSSPMYSSQISTVTVSEADSKFDRKQSQEQHDEILELTAE